MSDPIALRAVYDAQAAAQFQAGADVLDRLMGQPFGVLTIAGQPIHAAPENSARSDAWLSDRLDVLAQRLEQVQEALDTLVRQRTVRDWYDTAAAAEILGKAEFTVREWCRLGRIRAEKRQSGRGKHQSWVVSHAELQRFQREGLLPLKPHG